MCVVRVLLALLPVAAWTAAASAAAPPAPLTPAQHQQWAQRDRLLQQAQGQANAGQIDQAIVAVRQALALERRLLGEVSVNGLGWLGWLAELQEEREQFAAAIASRRELLRLWRQCLGAD